MKLKAPIPRRIPETAQTPTYENLRKCNRGQRKARRARQRSARNEGSSPSHPHGAHQPPQAFTVSRKASLRMKERITTITETYPWQNSRWHCWESIPTTHITTDSLHSPIISKSEKNYPSFHKHWRLQTKILACARHQTITNSTTKTTTLIIKP